MSSRFSNYGFLTLAPGETITVLGSEGIKGLNIYNPSTSTGNCTVTGKSGFTIGGKACNSIAIIPGAPPFNIVTALDNYDEDIDGITIVTAAGCTVLITAIKKTYN